MSSFRKSLAVRRRAAGDYSEVTGLFEISDVDSTFIIEASIQPTSGSDMKLLPENRREEEILKLYTDTELFGAIKGSPGNADIVEINGQDYEVVKTFPWQNNVINNYKIFVAKRTTNDNYPSVEEIIP